MKLCINGFYKNKKYGKCLKNIKNCFKMNLNQNHRCIKCSQNFVLNQSKTKCMKCRSYCLKCNLSKSCELCQNGYYPSYDQGNYIYFTYF